MGIKLKWQDGLAVVGVVLAVAGLLIDDSRAVIACLILLGLFLLFFIHGHTKGWSRQVRALLFAAVILAVGLICYRVYIRAEARELASYRAPLRAAHKPRPSNNCPIPADDLAIFFGARGAVTSANKFPHILVQMNGEQLLTLDRQDDTLLLTAKVFDDRGDIIARVSQSKDSPNEYWVRPDSRIERDDTSSLSIFDHKDNQVLAIHFLNLTTLKVAGIFRASSDPGKPFVISDDYALTPMANQYRGCFGNNGIGDFNIITH